MPRRLINDRFDPRSIDAGGDFQFVHEAESEPGRRFWQVNAALVEQATKERVVVFGPLIPGAVFHKLGNLLFLGMALPHDRQERLPVTRSIAMNSRMLGDLRNNPDVIRRDNWFATSQSLQEAHRASFDRGGNQDEIDGLIEVTERLLVDLSFRRANIDSGQLLHRLNQRLPLSRMIRASHDSQDEARTISGPIKPHRDMAAVANAFRGQKIGRDSGH